MHEFYALRVRATVMGIVTWFQGRIEVLGRQIPAYALVLWTGEQELGSHSSQVSLL